MQAAHGEFTTDFRPARLRNALVIGQVSVSVLLLICAAVLLRANSRIENLDVGLWPRRSRDQHSGQVPLESDSTTCLGAAGRDCRGCQQEAVRRHPRQYVRRAGGASEHVGIYYMYASPFGAAGTLPPMKPRRAIL